MMFFGAGQPQVDAARGKLWSPRHRLCSVPVLGMRATREVAMVRSTLCPICTARDHHSAFSRKQLQFAGLPSRARHLP